MNSEDADQPVLFFRLIGVLAPLSVYLSNSKTVYASCEDPDWEAW